MEERNIGYKVVYKKDDRFFSFLSVFEDLLEEMGIVEYIPGKWVGRKENCGPLTLFDNLKHAFNFYHCFASYEPSKILVFECEYIPIVNIETNDLWIGSKIKYPPGVPEGTIFCEKIKIIERKWHE